ncbi:TPA: hypothetical protein I8V98_002109 [Corynebacterium striatum]|nr:hypothetical protein [Corynebacterium striatum]HAT1392332.1 hypothetical protein [Corynebacterium striatum]
MSEIATYEPTKAEIQTAKTDFANASLDAIDRELEVIEKAARVVPTLIKGGMVPDIYLPTHQPKKNGPAQGEEVAIAKAMAAAVFGASLGFGIAKSLQNVFTVHGQPSIYARTAVALVQSRGHEVWVGEETTNSVTVYGRRRGSDKVFDSTWDIERAKTAEFTSNSKYKSQPQEMLYAKAAMAVCRRMAADVLEGVPMSVEELQLEDRPATVKAKAARMDRPGRGADGLQAALGRSTAREEATEGQPAEIESQAATSPEDEQLLADFKSTLAGLTTTDQVNVFVAELKQDPSVPEEALQMARDRWNVIAGGEQ